MNFKADESRDKLRGGYYTDPQIAGFLLSWVLEARPDTLLEPSCGDGVFLRRLRDVPGHRPRITAFEIDPVEAHKARAVCPRDEDAVVTGDFLEHVLSRRDAPPAYDAVVGNPPFIRYQYLDPMLQQRSEALIRSLGLRFTRHTNAWVPFVIGALQRLRPGGRLALVVPAELLHVLHAQSARTYLLRECERLLVLDLEDLWFTDTLQGVVLLLAEKRPAAAPSSALGQVAIQRIARRALLSDLASTHFERASFVNGDALPGKWTHALLSPRERSLLDGVGDHPDVHLFDQVAAVQVGIVTGANQFFLVSDAVVEEYDLAPFAHPMFGRSEHVSGVIYDAERHAENRTAGRPTNFLWFAGTAREDLPPGPLRYVELGEGLGLHQRYKCRIRQPWYEVPSVFSAPVGMLKRSHDYPRLVLNTLGAFTTDTAYRIRPLLPPAPSLVGRFVNSLTALSAELEGRQYGGGVLELVPSEIRRLVIPLPPGERGELDRLDRSLRSGAPPAEQLAAQDRVVLAPLGLTAADQADLQAAWWRLRNRRQRRASEPG